LLHLADAFAATEEEASSMRPWHQEQRPNGATDSTHCF